MEWNLESLQNVRCVNNVRIAYIDGAKNISKYRMIKNVVGILDNKLIFRLIKYDLKQILPFIFWLFTG